MTIGNYIAGVQTSVPWLPGWAIAVGLFFAILTAGLVLQHVLVKLIARFCENKSPLSRSLFRRTRAALRFAFFIFAASVALPLIPLPPVAAQSMHDVMVAALVILLGWVSIIVVNTLSDRYSLRLDLNAADNLHARKAATQIRILTRAVVTLIIVITTGLALMSFDSVRQFGLSIFASAGVAGLVVGLAARPMLENLLAGIQLAITQPIRIDDAVVVENEWGRVEEFGATYVVVRLWDRRRLIVPLSYFLQNPFQNWTRTSASLIGSVLLYLDYTTPIDRIRTKLSEIVKASPIWDGDVASVQVTDAKEETIEVRILVSAANSSAAWDLRCDVREKLLAYIQAELPAAIPHRRSLVQSATERNPSQPKAVSA